MGNLRLQITSRCRLCCHSSRRTRITLWFLSQLLPLLHHLVK